MPAQGLLITGTDTGVGKTLVACGLAAVLRRKGLRVAPLKPAETGCKWDPASQSLIPADALLLREACQTEAPLETICPYRFAPPLAPAVAAEQAGVSVDPQWIETCYETLIAEHDIVLVETAGGILVPLARDFHYGDLARRLHLPVVVVVGSKLGAINHALLTFEYLRCAGIPALTCVLNHPFAEKSPSTETNEATLRPLLRCPLYGIPHFPAGMSPRDHEAFGELADYLPATRSERK
ncbi:MAG: dethiobiotin synthase [Acidobacteria bacterium]|nr:dethiobiotin synthase [Acidobacteriota bacterium]